MTTDPIVPEDHALVAIQGALAKTSITTRRRVVEKFILAALGSVPWVGGFISAAASLKTDQRGIEKDNLQTRWLEEHSKKMERLSTTLSEVAGRFDSLEKLSTKGLQAKSTLVSYVALFVLGTEQKLKTSGATLRTLSQMQQVRVFAPTMLSVYLWIGSRFTMRFTSQ